MGMGKKGLVNSLYHSCSTDPQFLRVVNWSRIATKACILEPQQFNDLTPRYSLLTPISDQSVTCKTADL